MHIEGFTDGEGIEYMQIKRLVIFGKKYPYKNKIINIIIQFSDSYPATPPKMYVESCKNQPFLHANVYHDNG